MIHTVILLKHKKWGKKFFREENKIKTEWCSFKLVYIKKKNNLELWAMIKGKDERQIGRGWILEILTKDKSYRIFKIQHKISW